MTCWS